MPMNPEIKARWVAALRSGEYKQGKGGLRVRETTGDSYHCCLGVLCVVMGAGDEELCRGTPSHHYWSSAGLEGDEGGNVTIGGIATTLARHNDGSSAHDDGRTFAEIADAIEAQL